MKNYCEKVIKEEIITKHLEINKQSYIVILPTSMRHLSKKKGTLRKKALNFEGIITNVFNFKANSLIFSNTKQIK